jgi:hypothetical protein
MEGVPEELVDVSPEEFVATRDALAKRLKGEGNAEESAAVKKLRKPTVTQWITNQVRRHHADEVDALRAALSDVAAGQEVAITRGDRDAMRDATARRRDAVSALGHAVDEVLSSNGRPAHHRDEVLGAIESEVTAEISSGTFGVREDLELPDRPTAKAKPARDRVAERRAAEAKASLEAAEARVARARAELERAEAALAELVERHST